MAAAASRGWGGCSRTGPLLSAFGGNAQGRAVCAAGAIFYSGEPMTAATVAAAPASGLIQQRLRAVRQRLLWQRFLDCLGQCLLGGGGVLLALGVSRYFHGLSPWSAAWALGLLILALLAAAGGTLRGWMDLAQTAAAIDARARTHDRFHTALAFGARPVRTPLEELTLAECARFIEDFPVRRWTPIGLPRQLAFVPVPLIALAMLCWHAALGIGQPPRDRALDAAVSRRAHALDQLADKVRRADAPPEAKPALDQIADEMRKSAARLKQASDGNDPEKLRTALKEISSLEAMLNAMKQAAREQKISPAEMQALAAALAANEQTREAAESLQKGDLARAGDQLQKLLEQLKQQGADADKTIQQLAQSMQEQAAKLSEQQKNEVARQMQQAAQGAQGGQPQLSQQALQRLAELLRQAGKNGGQGQRGRQQAANGSQGGQGGQPMTEKQLQDLINALENMKDGMQPGGDPQQGQGEGSQRSLALVEEFGKNPGGNSPPNGKPSGMPGSEHDTGHPDKLFADQPPDAAKIQGQAHRLEGMLGDGASLQQLTGAAGGPAKAGRPYKDLYDAMAPAAQDSVEQENIPLGSRHFVRQYFENIRPPN